MTIGLTWRRTARRIKRLKETVLSISPDYSDRPTPDLLTLSKLVCPEVPTNEYHSLRGAFVLWVLSSQQSKPRTETVLSRQRSWKPEIPVRPQESLFPL